MSAPICVCRDKCQITFWMWWHQRCSMGFPSAPLVALLNGNVSDSGVDMSPFKDLGGVLSRLGPEQRRLGGPLTEAIKVALLPCALVAM